MNLKGQAMKGMVYVAPAGVATDEALKGWIDRAVAVVKTLPDK